MEKSTLGEIVKSFRECGIGFELDDFGSRYANMSIFSNIKFKTIKLDKSLINDLPGNEISRMLVKNIAEICETFGMKCIAEGVETGETEGSSSLCRLSVRAGVLLRKAHAGMKFEEEYLNTRTRKGGPFMADKNTVQEIQEEKEMDSHFIIGIGASAGGLEALVQQFFQHMPGNSGLRLCGDPASFPGL